MKVEEIQDQHYRLMVVGPPGSGKTHLLGLIHNKLVELGTRGLYIFDFDKGIRTLKNAGFNDVEFDYYIDKDKNEPQAFTDWAEKFSSFELDTQGFGAIAVDSYTSFESAAIRYVKKMRPSEGRLLDIVPTLPDWGALVFQMMDILPQLLNISTHLDLIFTFHMQTIEHHVSKEVFRTPQMTGRKLPFMVGAWFNEVWKISSLYGQRTIQTRATDDFECKTQISGMPNELNPEEAVEKLYEDYKVVPRIKEVG